MGMNEADREILAKGSSFIGLMKVIAQEHGPEACERVLSAAPRELAEALRYGHIVSVGWFPGAWYAQLHAAIDQALPGSQARTLARLATENDFNSVHRLVAKALKVETLVGQAHRLMGLYWKGGTIERLDVVSGSGRLRLQGWHGFTRHVWEDLMGSVEAVLAVAGARNAQVRALGPIDDTPNLDLEARWGEDRPSSV